MQLAVHYLQNICCVEFQEKPKTWARISTTAVHYLWYLHFHTNRFESEAVTTPHQNVTGVTGMLNLPHYLHQIKTKHSLV